jgi:hypothetical protein
MEDDLTDWLEHDDLPLMDDLEFSLMLAEIDAFSALFVSLVTRQE